MYTANIIDMLKTGKVETLSDYYELGEFILWAQRGNGDASDLRRAESIEAQHLDFYLQEFYAPNVSKSGDWRYHWGDSPLPDGARAIGTIRWDKCNGALIEIDGVYYCGNRGEFEPPYPLHPQSAIKQALTKITPHKGGRTEIVSTARVTPETKTQLQTILDQRGISYADWVTEMVERESGG